MSGATPGKEDSVVSSRSGGSLSIAEPTREDTDIIGVRVGAELIDNVIMFILYFGTFTVIGGGGTALGGEGNIGAAAGSLLLGTVLSTVSLFIYNFALEGWWNGQTIGKRLLGVRVVQENGDEITPGKAAIRALPLLSMGFVALIPLLGSFLTFFVFGAYLLAGIVAIAISDKRQRIFDRLAGTVVIK